MKGCVVKYFWKAFVATVALWGSGQAMACSTQFKITLETFGEGVLVELRGGVPGRSRVLSATRSYGGAVNFHSLCAGSYFLAIGNDESVSVTPTRQFADQMIYTSRITFQRGSGNVSSQSRKSL